jgi:predicted ABC-class ATPase
VRDTVELERLLLRIDGKGYKAYKALEGPWRFDDFVLHVDHVQGDPFAAPTRVRVALAPEVAGLDPDTVRTPSRALGTAAFLARAFASAPPPSPRVTGTGKSGEIRMEHPGQTVMRQTAVSVGADGSVEARFTVGLPARGRTALGKSAVTLLAEQLPARVRATLVSSAHDAAELLRAAEVNEDADALRAALDVHGLVAFVADGARLPRRTGIDDRPLEADTVVPFVAPESLRVSIDLPNAGTVLGMAVKPGVTLIVGGGYHGKSTLLSAIQNGVFNHRPGDGRELVVTRADAVKIRAEDGRSVSGVDISSFIDGLPGGRDTHRFSTPNASGSTSQAAAIVEAIEGGADTLLLDEDTSATNFMIRDRRMQALVPKAGEPITPFVDRVRDLHTGEGVSCVLVLGGSGDYLDVADTVVRMRDYRPEDATVEARRVATEYPTGRRRETSDPLRPRSARRLPSGTLDPSRGRRSEYVRVPDHRTLLFGEETIDLVAVEQLQSRAQIRSIGLALAFLASRVNNWTVAEALDAVQEIIETEGLDALDARGPGNLSAFRRHELAAALNRLRTLRVL